MSDKPDDLDDWMAGLTGQRPARPGNDEASVLRALEKVHESAGEPLSPSEEQDFQQLMSRLNLEVTSTSPESDRFAGKRTAPRMFFRTQRLALAASIAFVAVIGGIVFEWTKPTHQESGIDHPEGTRGVVGGLELFRAQPEIEAGAVLKQLSALGLQPHRLNQKDSVVISVTVELDHLPAFGDWMESNGGAARAPGTYRIVIVRQ